MHDTNASKMLKRQSDFNEQLREDMESSLKTLKLSAVEKFIDDYKQNGNVLFSSFENCYNTHEVTKNLMRDIATYARKIWTCRSLFICMASDSQG